EIVVFNWTSNLAVLAFATRRGVDDAAVQLNEERPSRRHQIQGSDRQVRVFRQKQERIRHEQTTGLARLHFESQEILLRAEIGQPGARQARGASSTKVSARI